MTKFLKDLISGSNEMSSKRASAIFTLVNIIVLTYVATFTQIDHVCPEFMFDALCLIAGGGFGLTTIEKIFDRKKDNKTE